MPSSTADPTAPPPVKPPLTRPRRPIPRGVRFGVATTALVVVFFASGLPVPLYNTFRADDGITSADLALTTVAYLATTAMTLLVVGRLSDYVGRRLVVLAAVGAAIAGCVVLTQVQSLLPLVAGRMLQGLGCGLASTAAGAMVLDLAPRTRLRWLPAVITSSAPPFAIPAGALLSGVLVQFAPAPRVLGLTLTAAVLLAVGVLVAVCPDTAARRAGGLRSLVPRVAVPAGAGRVLAATGFGLLATWSFSGFYQAFAPPLTADYLGTDAALMVALVFSSIVILTPVGGSLAGRLPATPAWRVALVVFVTAVVGVVMCLHAEAIGPFLAVSAVAGIAQGAANSAGMRAMFARVDADDRAGTLATLYLISYAGAAVPGLVAGPVSRTVTLPDVAGGYAVLVAAAAAAAIGLSVIRRTRSAATVSGAGAQ